VAEQSEQRNGTVGRNSSQNSQNSSSNSSSSNRTVISIRLEAASQNGGGGAIKTVEYNGWESNSRIVKTALGLEQVGRNSYLADLAAVQIWHSKTE